MGFRFRPSPPRIEQGNILAVGGRSLTKKEEIDYEWIVLVKPEGGGGLGREGAGFCFVPRVRKAWNAGGNGLGNGHVNCKRNKRENFVRTSSQPQQIVLCCKPPTTNGGVMGKNLDTTTGFC